MKDSDIHAFDSVADRHRKEMEDGSKESCCDGVGMKRPASPYTPRIETEGIDLHPEQAVGGSYSTTLPTNESDQWSGQSSDWSPQPSASFYGSMFTGGIVEIQHPTPEQHSEFMDEAKTREERESVYGDCDINNTTIGLQWTALLRQAFQNPDIPQIEGWLVALMMCALKLNRLAKTPTHEDSDHDLRVYLSIAKEIAQAK